MVADGKLTEIVRQERMIELYLEQQNFWGHSSLETGR